jgi:nitroreductase
MASTQKPAGDSSAAEDAIRFVVEAAVWAPSVHNTQPWWFGTAEQIAGRRISLHADVDRRLDVADPDGREMVMSCGAALFTLRVAIRDLGHDPAVTVLPDADRPGLLADVMVGDTVPYSEENRRLYRQIRRRRTHRGAFLVDPLPVSLLAALRYEAQREGAELRIVADDRARAALGALTEAAEHVQRTIPAYLTETARWAPRPGAARQDGVHESAYPRAPQRTAPHYSTRDFARGQGWGTDDPGEPTEPRRDVATGVVALLTTHCDNRADWLCAGQALQRILLRASVDDVSAAFHTQALEVPELREFIRVRFCDGAHPQMLLRLGYPTPAPETTPIRRPAADVTANEP